MRFPKSQKANERADKCHIKTITESLQQEVTPAPTLLQVTMSAAAVHLHQLTEI